MEFGDRLKQLREDNDLTQEDLGKIINVTKANISKYETHKLQPNIETIKLLAEYFSVSIDYLLGYTNNPKGSINTDTDIEEFIKNHDIKYCGEPVDEEDKESLLDFMKLAFKTIKNKKK